MTKLAPVYLAMLALTGVMAGTAVAAEEKSGRFSMSPVDGGFVRLDTETGEMSLCKRAPSGDWACEPMPEKPGLKSPDGNADAGPDLAPPEDAAKGKIPIPSEQDVDKLFDYVEGMMKKLKERLKRLEEQQEKAPATPL